MKDIKQPLLPHIGIFQPLKTLIGASVREREKDADVSRVLLNLLGTISIRLQRFPHNVDLFIDVSVDALAYGKKSLEIICSPTILPCRMPCTWIKHPRLAPKRRFVFENAYQLA